MSYVRSKSLNYERFKPLSCKDIGIRKFELVANTQLLFYFLIGHVIECDFATKLIGAERFRGLLTQTDKQTGNLHYLLFILYIYFISQRLIDIFSDPELCKFYKYYIQL